MLNPLWRCPAGACIIRRLVGIAHVADLGDLPVALRAPCERAALRFGRQLLVGAGSGAALPPAWGSVGTLVAAAAAAATGAQRP